jgi:hypothetical protein
MGGAQSYVLFARGQLRGNGELKIEIDTFFKAKLWAKRIHNKIGKKYAEMDNIQQASQADVKGNSRTQRATIKYLDCQIKISVILQLT